jgi:hypothetical protein
MSLSLPVSIVVGCCVLAVSYVGYREYEHRRDVAEATEVVKALAEALPSVSPVRSDDPRVGAEVIAASRPRRLAVNQRCVGGLVVTVVGSSYTQAGERCSGDVIVR